MAGCMSKKVLQDGDESVDGRRKLIYTYNTKLSALKLLLRQSVSE